MEKIVTKVEKQELEISYIKKTLDELVAQNKKQNEQLVKISESIHKQEVILEKISNLEERYSEGMARVHKRIDEELRRCKKDIDQHETLINEIKDNINTRPCTRYEKLQTEIEFLRKQHDRHTKIFGWMATLIIGAVVSSIIASHFNK